jgi:hypothetical protein
MNVCGPRLMTKKKSEELFEPEIIGIDVAPPARHQFGAAIIHSVVMMLLASISARGAASALRVSMNCLLGNGEDTVSVGPSYSSARLWFLRVGYAKLMRPKTQATDWIWIIDHTLQTGTNKCLVILGIRQAQLRADYTLSLQDVEPILIAPLPTSTAAVVATKLAEASLLTGAPRAIVSDGGSDLRAGIRTYLEAHPSTAMIYDIHHKSALELKRILERDKIWQDFSTEVNHFKRIVQQTPLAALAPPAQRGKARFMNVDVLMRWCRTILIPIYKDPLGYAERLGVTPAAIEAKLAWVTTYEAHISRWDELSFTVEQCTEFIRREGYHATAADAVVELLGPAKDSDVCELRERLLTFMREQSAAARTGERLLGCSDVIESTFGKFKRFEGEQAKSGFTASVLAIAALVSVTTRDIVVKALESYPVKSIAVWATEHIGRSVTSQRRELTALAQNAA